MHFSMLNNHLSILTTEAYRRDRIERGQKIGTAKPVDLTIIDNLPKPGFVTR